MVYKTPGNDIFEREMTTYILLLRGVTPSGRNKVPMARFREVLEKAGFAHVRTYIQSGNALVDTKLPAYTVEKSVRELIRDADRPRSCRDSADRGHNWKKPWPQIRLQKVMISPGYFLFLLKKHLRHRRSGSCCLWISPRKNLPLVKIPLICTFQVSMAGEHSQAIFWKRNSVSQPRCAISRR